MRRDQIIRIGLLILRRNPRADTTHPVRNTSARIIPNAHRVRHPVIIRAARTTPARRNIPDYAIAAMPIARASAASAARGGGRKHLGRRKRRPYGFHLKPDVKL
jgi:hypothetical protein